MRMTPAVVEAYSAEKLVDLANQIADQARDDDQRSRLVEEGWVKPLLNRFQDALAKRETAQPVQAATDAIKSSYLIALIRSLANLSADNCDCRGELKALGYRETLASVLASCEQFNADFIRAIPIAVLNFYAPNSDCGDDEVELQRQFDEIDFEIARRLVDLISQHQKDAEIITRNVSMALGSLSPEGS